jgi:hypothetical protein
MRIDGARIESLAEVVNHLGQFRHSEMMAFNETDEEWDEMYVEGYLNGIEAAKNEVWRLNGDRPL